MDTRARGARPHALRRWLALGAVCLPLYFLAAGRYQGWVLLGVNLASGAVMVATRRGRGPWALFGAGLLVYGFGNCIWVTVNLLMGAEQSIVGVSNLFFGLGYMMCALALLRLIRRAHPEGFAANMVDALIVVSASAVLWWSFLVEPLSDVPGYDLLDRVLASLYPLTDILLLALLVVAVMTPMRTVAAGKLLLWGLAAMLVADGIYYWYAIDNAFSLGGVADALWIVSFFAYGAAALHPSARDAPAGDGGAPGFSPARFGWFVVMGVVGPVTLEVATLAGGRVGTEAFVAGTVSSYLLVLARMVWLLRRLEAVAEDLRLQRRALRASEERHQKLLQTVNETIYQVDMQGRWTFLSPAWERHLGFSIAETLGRNVLDIVHPDDHQLLLETMAPVMSGEAPLARACVRYVNAKGEIRWGEAEAAPVFDEEGRQIGVAGTLEDVTARKEAELALAAAEKRYRTLVEQIPALIYIDSLEARAPSIYVSPRIEDVTGYTPREWLAKPDRWISGLNPADRERVLAERERVARTGEPFSIEYRFRHRDGHELWLRDEAVLITDDEGSPLYWQGVVTDITHRKTLEQQLTHQAFHDPLTGLANRALLSDRVEHALARASRSGETLALLFLDLDNFKGVNDSLGHNAGDELLRLVSARIGEVLRPSDTAARLGGDEFAVLLEDSGAGEAAAVAGRILAALQEPFVVGSARLIVNASVGIALSGPGATLDDLLGRADTAMYEAKRQGRGRAVVYEEGMRSGASRTLELHTALRAALDTDEITLHYQPVFELGGLTVVGVEALVRWERPGRATVAPSEFIPVAEETGLIVPLGEMVLRRACQQAARWNAELGRAQPLRVGVNFSPRQLADDGIVDRVISCIESSGILPEQIIAEITESALMHDPEDAARKLTRLVEFGISVAVDDFGTGYSSLSHLRRFPVRILKLDRYFVQGSGERDGSYAQAVVALGRSLGLDVVAEGIETEAELDALRAFGCPFGQGFLLGRPQPPEGLSPLLVDGVVAAHP